MCGCFGALKIALDAVSKAVWRREPHQRRKASDESEAVAAIESDDAVGDVEFLLWWAIDIAAYGALYYRDYVGNRRSPAPRAHSHRSR